MKIKNFKKLCALFLASAMIVGMLSGCGSEKDSNDSSQSSTQSESETAGSVEQSPSSDENDKVKLTIGIVADPYVEDFETNMFTQMMEEANNVDLEFNVFPANANDAKSKLTMMVSSNSELPDIICMEVLDDTTIFEYGSKGIFLPLDDYINDPNATKNFHSIDEEDFNYMVSKSKSPDGHIYGFSQYVPWAWNTGSYRMWVNDNWLEKLNLPMPETTEDFYNVLKAFVSQDPNGNNTKDEIGLVGAKEGWGLNIIPYIMNAFVYANPDKNYLGVENGKIVPSYTQDAWKEGLEFIKKLVDEGLVSPLSFTQDESQLRALVRVEDGVAGFVTAGSYSTFDAGNALEYDEMQLVGPLTGPNGVSFAAFNPVVPTKVFFITKDCKNVEKAIELADWFYTEEASMHSRFGEYGVNWNDDPEELKLWATRFEDVDALYCNYPENNPWATLQNVHWMDRNPKYRSEETMMGEGIILYENMPDEDTPPTQAPDFCATFNATYAMKMPKEYISVLTYTAEETEAIAIPSADIINHVKDMSVAFVTGSRSLSEWDNYLAELDAMGLEEYIKVVQAAYDRSK